jgi:hypothetical protein
LNKKYYKGEVRERAIEAAREYRRIHKDNLIKESRKSRLPHINEQRMKRWLERYHSDDEFKQRVLNYSRQYYLDHKEDIKIKRLKRLKCKLNIGGNNNGSSEIHERSDVVVEI